MSSKLHIAKPWYDICYHITQSDYELLDNVQYTNNIRYNLVIFQLFTNNKNNVYGSLWLDTDFQDRILEFVSEHEDKLYIGELGNIDNKYAKYIHEYIHCSNKALMVTDNKLTNTQVSRIALSNMKDKSVSETLEQMKVSSYSDSTTTLEKLFLFSKSDDFE